MIDHVMMMADGGGGWSLQQSFERFSNEHADLIALGGQEYVGMRQAYEDLATRRGEYWSQDESEALRFWDEVKEFFSNPLEYRSERQNFTDAVEELRGRLDKAFSDLDAQVRRAELHIDVPKELEPVIDGWREAADEIRIESRTLARRRSVEGWTGRAAEDYSTMAAVQEEAGKELRDLPKLMHDAVALVHSFNITVMTAVLGSLRRAYSSSSMCWASDPKEFYVRSANLEALVSSSAAEIDRALNMARGSTDKLESDMQEIRTKPIVIGQGWPSGMAQAGQAASMGGDLTDTAEATREGGRTSTPGQDVEGIHR